jgi:hypothetical protein
LNIDNVTLDGHYVAHFVVFHTKIFYWCVSKKLECWGW